MPVPSTTYLLCWTFWLLNSIHITRLEVVHLEKIWHEISIKEQYEFQIPHVDVNCACRVNQGVVYEPKRCSDDFKNQSWSGQICIHYNASARAQCWIEIWSPTREKYYTAYKISHTRQLTIFTVSYSNGNYREKINIPKGIHRIKITDNAVLQFDTSNISFDNLTAVNWFYGERNNNDIQHSCKINDVNEWSLSKLGWYRLNLATGKYEVDEKTVKNSLIVEDRGCPTEYLPLPWTLKSNYYYNRNGLLRSSLPGKSLNNVTGRVVDNVVISSKEKTISIEYKTNLRNVNFLPSSHSESFNFSALITVDRYENKLVYLTVHEVDAQRVTVEIGIPGTTRSVISFYHEKANQIHVYRVSASEIRSQWMCAYPSEEYRRCTCVNAAYQDFSIPDITENSTFYFPIDSRSELATVRKYTQDPLTKYDHNQKISSIVANAFRSVLAILVVSIIILVIRNLNIV